MKNLLIYLLLAFSLTLFSQYTPEDSVWQDGRIRDWKLWGYPTTADTLPSDFDSAIVTKYKMDALHDWAFDSIPLRDSIVMNMISDSTQAAKDYTDLKVGEIDSITEVASDDTLNIHVGSQTYKAILNPDSGSGGADTTFINVNDYGAVADSATDNTAAIQAAITAAQDGQTIIFPTSGYYLVTSTIYVNKSVKFDGNRGGKIIMNLTDTIFQVKAHNVRFDNMILYGGAKQAVGISIVTYRYCKMTLCDFYKFSRGIFIDNTYQYQGHQVMGCKFEKNSVGVYFDPRGEYCHVFGSKFMENVIGLQINAGNILIDACDISGGPTGIDLDAGYNCGHGLITGCQINHTQTPLNFSGCEYGETVTGCNIYYGDIIFENMDGINIIGGAWQLNSLTIDNCDYGKISGVKFLDVLTPTFTFNNLNDFIFENNTINDKTNFDVNRYDLGMPQKNLTITNDSVYDWGQSKESTLVLTSNTNIKRIENLRKGNRTLYVQGNGYNFTFPRIHKLDGHFFPNALNALYLECENGNYWTGKIEQVNYSDTALVWEGNTANARVDTNSITKITDDQSLWNAGAYNTRPLKGNDWWMTVDYNTGIANAMVGVTGDDYANGNNYTTIDFAIYISGQDEMYKSENGSISGKLDDLTPGDILMIRNTSGTITYEVSDDDGATWDVKNTSGNSPADSMYVDCSIRSTSTLQNVRTSLGYYDYDPYYALINNTSDSIIVTDTINNIVQLDYSINRNDTIIIGQFNIAYDINYLNYDDNNYFTGTDIGITLVAVRNDKDIYLKWTTDNRGGNSKLYFKRKL